MRNHFGAMFLARWGARRPKCRRAHVPIRDIVNGPVCSWRVDIFPRRKALPLKLRNSLASRTSHHTPDTGECAASPHLGTLNPAPLLCRSAFQRRATSITAVHRNLCTIIKVRKTARANRRSRVRRYWYNLSMKVARVKNTTTSLRINAEGIFCTAMLKKVYIKDTKTIYIYAHLKIMYLKCV